MQQSCSPDVVLSSWRDDVDLRTGHFQSSTKKATARGAVHDGEDDGHCCPSIVRRRTRGTFARVLRIASRADDDTTQTSCSRDGVLSSRRNAGLRTPVICRGRDDGAGSSEETATALSIWSTINPCASAHCSRVVHARVLKIACRRRAHEGEKQALACMLRQHQNNRHHRSSKYSISNCRWTQGGNHPPRQDHRTALRAVVCARPITLEAGFLLHLAFELFTVDVCLLLAAGLGSSRANGRFPLCHGRLISSCRRTSSRSLPKREQGKQALNMDRRTPGCRDGRYARS